MPLSLLLLSYAQMYGKILPMVRMQWIWIAYGMVLAVAIDEKTGCVTAAKVNAHIIQGIGGLVLSAAKVKSQLSCFFLFSTTYP